MGGNAVTPTELQALIREANGAAKDINHALAVFRAERASIIAGAREAMRDEVTRLIAEFTVSTVREMRTWHADQLNHLNDSVAHAQDRIAHALNDALVIVKPPKRGEKAHELEISLASFKMGAAQIDGKRIRA